MPNDKNTPTIADTIASYRENIPIELRHLRRWHVHIGKLPTDLWTDQCRLKTFDEAIALLEDQQWLDDRRRYFKKKYNKEASLKPPGLLFVLRNTDYWVGDYDPRKTYDQFKTTGNYIVPTGLKAGRLEELGEDQQRCLDQHKRDQWGYPSSSNVGGHVWIRRSDCRKIGDNVVHVKIGDQYIVPFEIKHEIIYFAPILTPFNDRTTIGSNCPIFDKAVEAANLYDKQRTTKPARVERPVDDTWYERTQRRLLDQYRWCHQQQIDLIPADHDGYGGWIKRLKAFGFANEKITSIAENCPGFVAVKDHEDIAAATPYDNPRLQARIEFDRLKALGAAGKKPSKKKQDTDVSTDLIKIPASLGKANGFKRALQLCGVEVRYNELVGIEVRVGYDGKWRELDDAVFHDIAINIVAKRCLREVNKRYVPFELDGETKRAIFLMMAKEQPPYNPTREWINRIPAKEDRAAIKEYMNCYLIDCYGRLADAGFHHDQIEDYYLTGFELMMAGWIMRSLKPGCLYDKFVVLIGEKGCGKGLGLQLQLPPEDVDPVTGKITPNRAFKDQCRLSDDRSAFFHNRKASLGEVTELIGFSKPGNEKLKAIISSTEDNQELKYQNYNTTFPKHYGLVGTTNNLNFKPADGEGDRRTYPMDLGYRWPGGKKVTAEMIPKILTDEWRRRAIGHIKWLIENGYRADHRDWPDDVEAMRNVMVGQASKQYPRIEAALTALAHGTVTTHIVDRDGNEREKEDWAFYGYRRLILHEGLLFEGLPLNPTNHPDNQPTWMRLLALYDKTLVDKYDADKVKFVAIEHLGWTFHPEPKRAYGHKKQRNWLIPNPKVQKEEDETIPF